MKRWIWTCALLLFVGILQGRSQKKWDGEGGDGKWQNPLNWFPDGIPSATDDVVLDHQYVTAAFTISIIDTATTKIKSLTIKAESSAPIQVWIPPKNLTAPALDLVDPFQSLVIGPYGILINQSGATSGNSINMTGKMVIQNKGIYRHATLRGNTLLVSRLSETTLHPEGIFEFDVPGNGGYIISVSGRQFPTLQLSSRLAIKKTYNGSGNGELSILGNLIIADSSTLNLSINGNLLLKGNLQVNGKLLWQPTLADTTGRELRFYGDSSHIETQGQLKLGANFRKLVVSAGRLRLKSHIPFDSNYHVLQLNPNATLDLDTFSVTGPGIFQTNGMSKIIMAKEEGISNSSKGNIQLPTLQLDPSTLYFFTGKGDQLTGSRFPDQAGALVLDKPLGKLQLSRPIKVLDSIRLIRGNILSADTALLEFSGKIIHGTAAGFIQGPLKRMGKFGRDWLFPLGHESTYAPTILSVKDSSMVESYTISYHASPAPEVDSARKYPVKKLSRNEYWTLNRTLTHNSLEPNETIHLPIGANSLQALSGQPNLVNFDRKQNMWVQLPLVLYPAYPGWLSTIPVAWQDGNYTFGEMDAMALSHERLYLSWTRQREDFELSWKSSGDPKLQSLFLETSQHPDFNPYSSTASQVYPNKIMLGKNKVQGTLFVRLKGITQQNTRLYSNIVSIPATSTTLHSFPNPASSRLFMEKTEEQNLLLILQDGKKLIKPLNHGETHSWINVEDLPKGMHRLLLKKKEDSAWILFFKN